MVGVGSSMTSIWGSFLTATITVTPMMAATPIRILAFKPSSPNGAVHSLMELARLRRFSLRKRPSQLKHL